MRPRPALNLGEILAFDERLGDERLTVDLPGGQRLNDAAMAKAPRQVASSSNRWTYPSLARRCMGRRGASRAGCDGGCDGRADILAQNAPNAQESSRIVVIWQPKPAYHAAGRDVPQGGERGLKAIR
jgi:hypothetical protein